MARSGGWGVFAAVLTALALLAAPPPAFAAFAINIHAPGGPAAYTGAGVTVTDNTLGVDLDPTANSIVLLPGVSVGLPPITGLPFALTSALSDSPGSALTSLLSLSWFVASSSPSPTALQITASATGYVIPPAGTSSALISSVGGTFGGPPGSTGSVTAQQWVDLGNGLFATAGALPPLVTPGPQGPFLSPAPFSNTASVAFTSLTPYSITDRVNLSLGGVGSVSGGTLSSTVVPEPVTMFLGGTGLLMLTYAARRRLFGR
jgi:hypothetical protein